MTDRERRRALIRDRLLAEQGGRCGICPAVTATRAEARPGYPYPPTTWALDHDHATGFIRGVLCRSCNTLLGRHRDDAAALVGRLPGAVAYLSRPPSGVRY